MQHAVETEPKQTEQSFKNEQRVKERDTLLSPLKDIAATKVLRTGESRSTIRRTNLEKEKRYGQMRHAEER